MNVSLRPAAVVALFGAAFLLYQRRTRQTLTRLTAAALESLLYAIDANDQETGAHVRRVARYALILADAVGLDEHQRSAVERIALFHDIGKIHEALFDITHDHTTLTPAERRAIATHPRRGWDVLAPLRPFYPDLAEGVLAHHERWDGTGYPRRLRGRRIPLSVRIVSLADTFDVVAHGRPYCRAGGAHAAALVVAQGRGTQFDPQLVDLMLLPPVLRQLASVHASTFGRRKRKRGAGARPSHAPRSKAPDVPFRWRSESLARTRQG